LIVNAKFLISLDNRKQNLRNCTKRKNNLNQPGHRNSVSKYKGVYWKKDIKKWVASIKKDTKKLHLGYFACEADAAKAYDKAAKKYHGDFAALNFP
jgi:two-component SAPR family response regulator